MLEFFTPRDPAALVAFINLRVLNPEHEHWRGVEAAVIYAREHGDLKVPFTFRVPAVDEEAEATGWPASLAACRVVTAAAAGTGGPGAVARGGGQGWPTHGLGR